MEIHPKLAVFSYGFLQDATHLLTIMEQEGITLIELKESVKATAKNSVLLKPPKLVRRVTKENREREFGKTKFGRIRGGGHRK